MANDAYLQIESIKGESTDDKHKDWIEVSNVLYAIHQPRADTVSTAGGHTSGRAELYPLSFTKLADLASPILLQTCATGKTIPKAVFEFMRADSDGKPIPYFRVDLENLMLSNISPDSGDAGLIVERVHVAYARIRARPAPAPRRRDDRQPRQQGARAGQLARQPGAHAHGQPGRRRLTVLDHVEVVVEGGDLVHLGLGQAELLRQGGQVLVRQAAVAVLDGVQVFDQQVAPARGVAQQCAHLVKCLRLDAATFRRCALARAAGVGADDRDDGLVHARSSLSGGCAVSRAAPLVCIGVPV
jgi:type VI secretion system secreted protein Hcp